MHQWIDTVKQMERLSGPRQAKVKEIILGIKRNLERVDNRDPANYERFIERLEIAIKAVDQMSVLDDLIPS